MACQRLFIGFSIGSFYYFAATTVGRNSRNNGCAASALRRHHHDRLDVGAIRRCGMRRAASLRLAARSAGIVVFFIATRSSATSKHAHKDVTHAVQYPSFRRALRKEQGPRPKQPLAPRPKQLLAPRLFGWNILRRLIWMLPALRRSQSARRCGEAPA